MLRIGNCAERKLIMEDARMKALIGQHDEYVQYRQKLADYHFADELLSLFNDLPTQLKHEKTDTVQFHNKIYECKRLKEYCLKIIREEVAKSFIKFEDHHNNYQALLNNYHVKEFQDFASFLKNRSKSNENVNVVLKSENEDLKRELEALKLHNLALNSNLKLAYESLNEQKLQCERIESERKTLNNLSEKLCSLLLKYQQSNCQLEEMNETTTQASCDDSNSSIIKSNLDLILRIDSSTSENSLGENDCSETFAYNDQSTISPPFGFGDDDILVENIDRCDFFSKKQEHCAETNTLEEAPILHKLRECVPRQNSNYSTSELTTPVNGLQLQIDVADIKMDHYLHSVQDIYNTNSPVNNSESIVINVLENSFIDSSMCTLPEPLKKNENLALSKTLNNRRRKSILQEDELPNLITPVEQHFTCDICAKSFLKKSGLICHTRAHAINNSQSFHCEKCEKSFSAKRKGQKLVKCPNCDARYITRSRKNEMELTSGLLEWKNNGDEPADIDNIHRQCENRNSNVQCTICNKHYSSKSYLNAHIRMVHNGEKPYKCVKCDKRFGHKLSLERHTLVHGSQKPFKCSVCKVGFKDPSDKRRHERIVHEGGARLQCAHCNQRFGRKQELISHIHTKHFSGFQKQFKCTICDKSFAVKRCLQNHMLSHSSKRSFECSVCDCTFKYLHSKIHHEKTVHGRGARFRCKHCDKVYQQKAYLIRHLQKNHVE